MASFTGQITIDRPVEVVFDTVADERNEPAYNPAMLASEKLTDGPVGAGTRFKAIHASRSSPVEMIVELTEFDRPRRLASVTTMRWGEFRGALTFQPAGSGTRMAWARIVRPKGAAKVLGPLAAAIGRRSERACWTGLKHYLEDDSRGRTGERAPEEQVIRRRRMVPHRQVHALRTAEPSVTGRRRGLRPIARAGLAVLVLLLAAAIGAAPLFPTSVTPASASRDVFSAERALAQLPAIAAEPHPTGSPAQARVRGYLVRHLAALGLQTQVQSAGSMKNVAARLPGTHPSGAVLILAHYDSVAAGPGAADNGSGVVTLLETMRALVAGPKPRNDVIALFDDAEESGFAGAYAFLQNRWMKDVRVVVNLDTAVQGPASINQTGPNNGWLVDILARSSTGGAWTSSVGGGTYDYEPFRLAGIQGLDLEDDYAFYQQHTALDRPGIVSAASVQQFGDQALSIARGLGSADLTRPWGPDQAFTAVPLLGLLHYPTTWELPLAALAAALFLAAVFLSLRRGLATWAGLGVALAAVVCVAGVAALGVGWLGSQVPGWFHWDTSAWVFWPQVVPPDGGYFYVGFAALVLVLSVGVYMAARRITGRVNFALAGLGLAVVLSLALYVAEPQGQIWALWPALIGSAAWCGAVAPGRRHAHWTMELAMLVAAAVACFMLVPVLVEAFMSQGLDGVAKDAALFALLLAIVLPVADLASPVRQCTKRAPKGGI